MRNIDLLVDQIDSALKHEWQSITSSLKDISEDEFFWQADCYLETTTKEGQPKKGTVHWHINHLTSLKNYYIECIKHRPSTDIKFSRKKKTNDYLKEINKLELAHNEYKNFVSELQDSSLTDFNISLSF